MLSTIYKKRINTNEYNDQLCKEMHLELESFKGDKYFNKIKKQILELYAREAQMDLRNLKYMYKNYKNNGTTKKLSGQNSCYLLYDEAVFMQINEKQSLKFISIQIIKPHIPSFKASPSYLSRLETRFNLWLNERVIFNESKYLLLLHSEEKDLENTIKAQINFFFPNFNCSKKYVKSLIERLKIWDYAMEINFNNIEQAREEIKKKFEEIKVSDEFLLRILKAKKENVFGFVEKHEYNKFEKNDEEFKADTINFCKKPKKLEMEEENDIIEKLMLNVNTEDVPEENKHFIIFSEKENELDKDFNDIFSLFLPKEEQPNDYNNYASNMETFNENENGTNFGFFNFGGQDSE